MKVPCRECGKMFHTLPQDGQIFCSVGCQLAVDSIDGVYMHRPVGRARPAKTGVRDDGKKSSGNE